MCFDDISILNRILRVFLDEVISVGVGSMYNAPLMMVISTCMMVTDAWKGEKFQKSWDICT
jgi:hypothetical protein